MRPVAAFLPAERLLTIEELAACLGRSVRTVHRLMEAGMPCEREGKRLLFCSAKCLSWLRECSLVKETPLKAS